MHFKNILVPYDESDHALSALHTALALAGPYPEARVHVITVIPAGALPGPTLMGEGIGTAYALSNPASYEELMDSVVGRARAEVDEAVRRSLDRSSPTRSSPPRRSRASPSMSSGRASTSWSWAGAGSGPCAACSGA